MKKTIVIIPHYNKLILLKECLFHLDEQNYSNFDVLIVDNGSTDGSAEYIYNISKSDSKYKYILNSDNVGFAKAVNQGISYAIANNYEFSLLLNNDAYVEKGFVERLTKSIESSSKLFAVSSMMINYHKKELIDSFGDNYSILSWAFQNHIGEKVNDFAEDETCFSACGGAAIYRNSVFSRIGLFDEAFFAYLEDVDVSYRAKLNGYIIKTCYLARCYHLGSATSGSKYNEFKVRTSARNNIYLIYKNMPDIQIFINIIPITLGHIVKQLFFIKKGFGLDYFFGIFDGLKTLSHVKRNDFKKIPVFNFISIEIELIINIFKYVINFSKRH